LVHTPQNDGERRPQVSGLLRGRPFRMSEVSVISPTQDGIIATRISLRPRGLPDGLTLYARPRGGVGNLLVDAALGAASARGVEVPPEVMTGDAAFDRQWTTRGRDPAATQAWMVEADHRQMLAAFVSRDGRDLLEDGLTWEGSTRTTIAEIMATVEELESVADQLERR
jgi:hypothetical protein